MSQFMTSEQINLFDVEKVPYGYCPNCYGGWTNLYPRSDIDEIQCGKCDTVVDTSLWEKRIEPKPNEHLRNLLAKYGYSDGDDW
jgi:hypothetical protein